MRLLIEGYLDRKPDFGQLSLIDQIMYMAYFYVKTSKDIVFTAQNIEECFEIVHLHTPTNMPARLKELERKRKIIPKSNGYSFQRETLKNLDDEFGVSKPKKQVSHNLRTLLSKISVEQKKGFLEEAISCYEIGTFRAAIVMCWLLTIDHLYDHVISKKLNDFNTALSRTKHKLSVVRTKDDLSEFKESIFIELCRTASIITNDERKILVEKLDIRNSCAHPNPIKISESKATSYIEDLIDNIM